MKYHLLCATSLAFLGFAPIAAAAPVQVIAGATVSFGDYGLAGVGGADPDWSGTLLDSFSATANRAEDGFDGFEVVTDLFEVTATVDVDAIEATNGQLVFRYHFGGSDVGLFTEFGLPNGIRDFKLSGFGNFGVTLAWDNTGILTPYNPSVERSADGDTISVTFLDLEDVLFGPIEPILLAVDAPSYSGAGSGSAAIVFSTFGPEDTALVGALPAPAPIPLPAGMFLLLGGLCGLALMRPGKA